MPNGTPILITEQTCEAKHDALGIEMRDLKDDIGGIDKKVFGIFITLVAFLGALIANLVVAWR